MSYTTFYALSWNNEEGKRNDGAIQEWIENDELRAEFEDLYECGASGNTRTLDSDAEMIRLSTAFPHVLFTLHGSGEDDDDLWISYYREGKVQHGIADVRYPRFDPGKLVAMYEPADPQVTPGSSSPPLPSACASNDGANTRHPAQAALDRPEDATFARIASTLHEQLDDRTIARLYFGIRSHPSLCGETEWERSYQDYRAAEAELYNFAAAMGMEVPDEEDQLQRCRKVLAEEIRAGHQLTSSVPTPQANNDTFLAYLDSPGDYPELDI